MTQTANVKVNSLRELLASKAQEALLMWPKDQTGKGSQVNGLFCAKKQGRTSD